jgi:F-type H+-transporting ATPase subunit b
MDAFGVLAAAAEPLASLATEAGGEAGAGPVINVFWILVTSATFVFFFLLIRTILFGPLGKMLADRQARIEQGLKDAEQARQDRQRAEEERLAALQEARREANEILARAQKVAQEQRDADIAATKADLERIRERATSEIEAEKQRALADLRAEVADLALGAAGKVVRETMTDQRHRRLVEEFLTETTTSGPNA